MIERNPGKGHPLRPEYLLSDPQLGADAAVLTDLLEDFGVTDVGLKRWPLPTLRLLVEQRRFSEIPPRSDADPERTRVSRPEQPNRHHRLSTSNRLPLDDPRSATCSRRSEGELPG